MTLDFLRQHLSLDAQRRLLLFTMLLLWTTLTLDRERAPMISDTGTSVFSEPPAYLHPPEAIGFDLSGVPPASSGVEAALLASARDVPDVDARAHTHMSLAVYYKLRGQRSRAEAEKRKGDYWMRVAKYIDSM